MVNTVAFETEAMPRRMKPHAAPFRVQGLGYRVDGLGFRV
jgi:hypothetical protein